MRYIADIPIVAKDHGLIISGFLFTTIACLSVSLRTFTRTVLVRNMGLDDYFIIAAAVRKPQSSSPALCVPRTNIHQLGSVAFLTATMYRKLHLFPMIVVVPLFNTFAEAKYGLGDAVHLSVIHNFLQALLATTIAYNFAHISMKFSILLQCRRIFSSTSAQRLFTGLIIWLSIYGLFCFLSTIITCLPVAKYWDDTIPGRCIDRSKLHYVLAGFNIVNDSALLVAPLPFLKKLHIAWRAKLVLIGVFACGGLYVIYITS